MLFFRVDLCYLKPFATPVYSCPAIFTDISEPALASLLVNGLLSFIEPRHLASKGLCPEGEGFP